MQGGVYIGPKGLDNGGWSIAFQQDDQLLRRMQRQIDVHFKGIQDYGTLKSILRQVSLKGDPAVQIYKDATIRIRKRMIDDLWPTALYVLRSQIAQHTRMFWHLQQYGQNFFDFSGIMQYIQEGNAFTIAPPIIETYTEPSTGRAVSAIIDGLHRIYAARQIGFDELWVIEISDLPQVLPPIALPVGWDELAAYDAVPPAKQKRRYRYNRAIDYPDLTTVTPEPVTPENYQYFLYRDLSVIGSGGIRQP